MTLTFDKRFVIVRPTVVCKTLALGNQAKQWLVNFFLVFRKTFSNALLHSLHKQWRRQLYVTILRHYPFSKVIMALNVFQQDAMRRAAIFCAHLCPANRPIMIRAMAGLGMRLNFHRQWLLVSY